MYYFKPSGYIRSFGVPSLVLALCGWVLVLTNATDFPEANRFLPLRWNSIRKLLQPCEIPELVPLRSLPQEFVPVLETVVIEILRNTLVIHDTVNRMIQMNPIGGCARLPLSKFSPDIVPVDVRKRPINETLQLFFTTQLNYTAHIYYMVEQLDNTAFVSCQDDETFLDPAKKLVDHMRDVLCSMVIAMNLTEGFNYTFIQDITRQIVDQKYTIIDLCYFKNYWHCQFLRGVSAQLYETKNYFWYLACVLLPTLDRGLDISYYPTPDTPVEVGQTSSVRFPRQLPESDEDLFPVTEGTWTNRESSSADTPVEIWRNIRSILMKLQPLF